MAGLCGQGCQAGRGGEPLASSVYLEAEIAARPGCCRGGCFHAGWGWGVPCCTHPRAACGMPAMGMQAGTWRCPHGAGPCCLPQLEPEEGCGDGAQAIREVGDTAGHPLPCSITALQGSTESPRVCPMPAGSLSWLRVPTLSMGLHPLCCTPRLAGSPFWLHAPAPSLALCTGCGAPHWLWMSVPALSPCKLCVPAPAGSLYRQCPQGDIRGT